MRCSQQIEHILQLSGPDVLRYADARKGQRRAMRLARGRTTSTRLDAFLLAGDTRAQAWIRTLLQDQLDTSAYGRQLLLPGLKAPVALAPQSKAVCSCFNVTQSRIESHLSQCDGSATQRLASLQQALHCGTNCGSCLPEVKRLVQAAMNAGAVAA